MGYNNFLPLQMGEVVQCYNSLFFASWAIKPPIPAYPVSQRLCGSTEFFRLIFSGKGLLPLLPPRPLRPSQWLRPKSVT